MNKCEFDDFAAVNKSKNGNVVTGTNLIFQLGKKNNFDHFATVNNCKFDHFVAVNKGKFDHFAAVN